MLGVEYPCAEPGAVIISVDWHGGLNDEGAGIQFRADKMDAGPMPTYALGDGAGMGVETGKGGQQGRVDVDQAAQIMFDKRGGQLAHESSKNDEVGGVWVDALAQGGIKCLPTGMGAVFDDLRGDARLCGPCQPRSIGTITEHSGDLRIGYLPVLTGPENAVQITAATGNQQHQLFSQEKRPLHLPDGGPLDR